MRNAQQTLEEVLVEPDPDKPDRDEQYPDSAPPTKKKGGRRRPEALLDSLIALETLGKAWMVASPRQRDILDCLTSGADRTELPVLLNLTPQAVATQPDRLRKKLKETL